jgi:hypothetical protein
MTILMVNGGGNTPNGEAARGDPDPSKSYLPMESLLPADSPDTSSTATFLEIEFDGNYNGDGSISLLGSSDALTPTDFFLI